MAEPGNEGFGLVSEREVFDGQIWRVVVGTFRAPDGSTFVRDIVRSPGAVGVVPVVFDCEGNASLVLVRQYRPVPDVWMLEIPAGMRDVTEEPPEETARRELVEEAGFAAERLDHLITFHPTAGMTDATTIVFLATGLTPTDHDRQGPEEAHLEVLQVPLADALAMVGDGRITDAKTVIGVLLTARHLARADHGMVHGSGDVPGSTSAPSDGSDRIADDAEAALDDADGG